MFFFVLQDAHGLDPDAILVPHTWLATAAILVALQQSCGGKEAGTELRCSPYASHIPSCYQNKWLERYGS